MHKALLLTFVVIIAVVAVVVAIAQYDMKMPGARARGLVVNIRRCRRRVVDVAPTRHDMNTR